MKKCLVIAEAVLRVRMEGVVLVLAITAMTRILSTLVQLGAPNKIIVLGTILFFALAIFTVRRGISSYRNWGRNS